MARKPTVIDPLNLTKTQKGYAPLGKRFKSFPKDSEKEPVTDQNMFFDNYANQTLEHATLDLILPIPYWIRLHNSKLGLIGGYRSLPQGGLRISSGRYRVMVTQ